MSQERHLLSEEYRALRGVPPSVSNFVECRRLRGRLDTAALIAALQRLVRQHAVLRVAAVPDDVYPGEERRRHVQGFAKTGLFPPCLYRHTLTDSSSVPVRTRDISSLPEELRTALLDSLWFEESVTPFDLSAPPLIRVTLLRTGDDDHMLVVTVPHYAADAQSLEICWDDLIDAYERLAGGGTLSPIAPEMRFYEIVSRLKERFDRGLLDASLTYWQDVWARSDELGGRISDLDFARRGASAAVVGGRSEAAHLDAATFQRLQARRRELRVSSAAIFLAALARLVQRHGNMPTVAPWVPLANRSGPGAERTVGWMTTAHIVPVKVDPTAEGAAAMQLCHRALVHTLCHQELPLQWLWDRRGEHGDGAQRVVFNYRRIPPLPQCASLHVDRMRDAGRHASTGGLDVRVMERPNAIAVYFVHSIGRFSADAVRAALAEYMRLVTTLVSDPTAALSRA